MRNGVEVTLQIGIDHMDEAGLEQLIDSSQRIFASATTAETIAVFGKVPFEDRFNHVHNRGLNNPVTNRRDPQRSGFVCSRLGDMHAPNDLGTIRSFPE